MARGTAMIELRPLMQFILSTALLAAALFVLLKPSPSPKTQKWAEWVIAMLIGYWLSR